MPLLPHPNGRAPRLNLSIALPARRAARRCIQGLALSCLLAVVSAPAVAQTSGAGYTKTRYPVVLVHGLFGFDRIGSVDYFYGIPKALRDGGATVFTPAVSAANSNEQRGEQLLRQLRELKAAYGFSKFNLIGHSQGGTTARYVAAVAPELVASVTTVGTPHAGSKVGDVFKVIEGVPIVGSTAAAIANGLASTIAFISGSGAQPQNALAALQSLYTKGAADFNRRFPQGAPGSACGQGSGLANGVRYYSASGTSVATNLFDVTDLVLMLSAASFGFERNDGLVSQCSSHWGEVIKDNYRWNHLDEVNQAFGLRGLFSEDPTAFYRSQSNRLKLQGL